MGKNLLALASFLLSGNLASAEVYTGTLNPGEEPVSFGLVGDFGDVNVVLAPARVALMVKGWDIDLFIGAGDLNYGSTEPGSKDWDSRIGIRYGDWIVGRADRRYPLQTATVQRFFPVVGNHDTSVGGLGGGDVKGYVDYFVKNPGFPDRLPTGSGLHDDDVTYYDFIKGNVHFIMADSDKGRGDIEFAESQNEWIRDVLRSSTSRWKFVVMHHPAWSSDGTHGNQTWMQGEHLAMADAVFAGHAHLYERIETGGTTFFTCGTGGRTFYPFQASPHPDSRFRFNTSHGAMRVTCTSDGSLMEFLSINDGASGANGGTVTDSITKGNYVPIKNTGEHPIELIAGQQVTLSVSGDGFVPELQIVAPDESTVPSGDFLVSQSGLYRFLLSSPGAAGDYSLSVTPDPESPESALEVWKAQHFGFVSASDTSGDSADPDEDGVPNLFEYAIGTDPNVPDQIEASANSPRFFRDTTFFSLKLAAGLRSDITYIIEAAGDLQGEWTTISQKTASNGLWAGTAPVIVSPVEGRAVELRIAGSRSTASKERRFYRLRAER